jgi:uncharacterized protein (TIGR03437 family)
LAPSSPNVLTQDGSNQPVSFTLTFSSPVSSLSFVRPQLLAGPNGIIFPQWTATAYNASGGQVGTAGEALLSSYANVPAATFTLSGSTSITSVRFDSNNQNVAAFSAVVIDNLILTSAASSGAAGPSINSGGIVSAASYAGGPAVGSIVAIFGNNLATGTAQSGGPPLPTNLGGVQVKFNGVATPLFYVSPTQINVQGPWEVAGFGALSAQVIVNGVASSSPIVASVPASPAIFTMDQSGSGQAAAVLNTGQASAPSGSFPGLTQPAQPGDFLTIYATGLGLVTNTPPSGSPGLANPLSETTTVPLVTIGGAPATVTYSGLAPGFVGLYQINVLVPPNLPTGDALPLQVSIGGVTASGLVTVAGQSATAAQNVNVVAIGPGSGTITSSPPGINCGVACSANFPAGTEVTLNVTPNAGSSFQFWSGDCSESGTCTVTIPGTSPGSSKPQAVIPAPFILYANLGLTTPPGSAPGPRINYTPPTLPNGQVGVPYSFPGCTPAPVPVLTGLCVPSLEPGQATNPSGGSPPYYFQLGTFGGFPPMGISLLLNGTLTGIPQVPGTYTFQMCPVDLQGDYDPNACDPVLNITGAGNTVWVTVNGTGAGTITSTSPQENPSRIQCPAGRCKEVFPAPSNVTLTANAAAGSTFGGWGGACAQSGVALTCALALAPPDGTILGVTATFNTGNTLAVQVNGQGSVTSQPAGISCPSACSAGFPANTPVQLTATAAAAWTFQSWGGDANGTGNPVTVTMTDSKHVIATFNQPSAVNYTLTVNNTTQRGGGGAITGTNINCGTTCSANYPEGTQVILTATPNSVSLFGGWSGDCAVTGPVCTLTMDSNQTATAVFTRPELTITKSGTGTGTVSASDGSINCGATCSAIYSANANVTLTAAPNTGSAFTGWSGAGTGTGSLALSMNADKSVVATFALANSGGTFSGLITGTTTGTVAFCEFQHKLSGQLTATISGSGMVANPYTGSFTLANGTDVVTVLSGPAECSAGVATYTESFTGPIIGSSGFVISKGTTSEGFTWDFENGLVGPTSVTGTLTLNDPDVFDQPITQTIILSKN